MRETITMVICIIIVVVALQTGLLRTGLDYETIKNNNTNLIQTNKRLTKEVQKIKAGQAQGLDQKNIKDMQRVEKELEKSLKRYIEAGDVELEPASTQAAIKVFARSLFTPKTATISDTGKKILIRIASTFAKYPDYEIVVAGFTNKNIITKPWSNEVSTHRALSTNQANIIVDWLITEGELESTRLVSAGHGYTRPSVKNNSATNRRKNHFMKVVLLPSDLETLEKARAILVTEKNPEYKRAKVKVEKKVKIKKVNADSRRQESTEEEVLGEDALDNIDEDSFESGYELPNQDVID